MMQEQSALARRGEDLACTYLRERGYEIIARNYRVGHGEIDIIARNNGVTVFVEVKTRSSNQFGPAEYAITPGKQRQLRRIAEGYRFHQQLAELPCRFDVITIEYERREPRINHLENAFTFYDR